MARNKKNAIDRSKKDSIFKKSARKKRKKGSGRPVKRRTAEDLRDLVQNKRDTIKYHTRDIRKAEYVTSSFILKYLDCEVPSGPYKGTKPKSFRRFKAKYRPIYNRWLHYVKACFEPEYSMYRFFGGKGIYASDEFLDAKKFCIWCLQKGIVDDVGMYTKYINRKDKTKDYSLDNVIILNEEDIRKGKDLKSALTSLLLAKRYEEYHDPSITFMTAYTRFYVYDFNIDDTVNVPHPKRSGVAYRFSPTLFYKSVANESSCSLSTFLSRIHYAYLDDIHVVKPYDMLDPKFSVSFDANANGKLSYKQQWERNRSDDKKKPIIYSNTTDVELNSNPPDVYTYLNSIYQSMEKV